MRRRLLLAFLLRLFGGPALCELSLRDRTIYLFLLLTLQSNFLVFVTLINNSLPL